MKFALGYKMPVLKKGSTTPVEATFLFELSQGGVWFCRQNKIAMTEKSGTQRTAQKIAAKLIPYKVKGDIVQVNGVDVQSYKFDSKNRKDHQRTSASKPQYNRGKILTLRTGKYGAKPYQSNDVWEPKQFTVRAPKGINNGYILDAMRAFFKTFIAFTTTPTKGTELFPIVMIDKILYRIPDMDIAPGGDQVAPGTAGLSTAGAPIISQPDTVGD